MRAECKYVSVLDYSQGLGHTEALTVGESLARHAERTAASVRLLEHDRYQQRAVLEGGDGMLLATIEIEPVASSEF